MAHLSVIVPVSGDPECLEACLVSIGHSEYRDYELLVADDGSPFPERIAETCDRNGARLVRLENRQGPGPARNAAARLATGDILVFIDADVTVHVRTLSRMAEAFVANPSLDAVVGSYDLTPGCAGRIATFRNLLHAHVHHRSAGEITTFWTGCGAVRRLRFEQLGGFLHPVEDVEFGARLHEAGGRILLDPSIQVKHHKNWTLASMIRTDIVLRAMPWTELILEHGWPKKLNFRRSDRATVAASALFPALLWLALRHGGVWYGVAAAMPAAVMVLQWPLFRFFARQRGAAFAGASFPLFLVHQLSAAAGFLMGVLRWEVRRDRLVPWVAALAAVLVLGVIQWGGGAFHAEFDGFSDEASHFMTGLMLRDYMLQWPFPSPRVWAEQYYIHYPRVALGHWPPLFHLVEAAWWLFLPPSRSTVMLLIGLLGTVSALAFYRLARRMATPGWALVFSGLLVATPVFQRAAARVMTEQLILLLAVLFLDALVRFVEGGARREAVKLAVYCCLSVLVKGTGLSLVLAPVLALLIMRRPIHLRKAAPPALAVGAVILACVGWYLARDQSVSTMLLWAGFLGPTPWSLMPLVRLAGPGAVLVAAAGMLTLARSKNGFAAGSAALVLSTLVASYFLRAMGEPRQWIGALPALLLLDLTAIRWASEVSAGPRRQAALVAALAAVMIPFPWRYYSQQSAGSEKLVGQLRQPARFLVSALNPVREGVWVALISAREKRPSSVVARATKTLADESFSGRYYRLRVSGSEETEAALDRWAIQTVVLDEHRPANPSPPHHGILRRTLETSSAWRQCGRLGALSAFCRVLPPKLPREPLRMKLQGPRGRVLTEK